jgi:hypothetical protein
MFKWLADNSFLFDLVIQFSRVNHCLNSFYHLSKVLLTVIIEISRASKIEKGEIKSKLQTFL